MTATEPGGKLSQLLEALGRHPVPVIPAPVTALDPAEPLLGEFVRSMLTWECTMPLAGEALGRIERAVVDYNELRVCLSHELIGLFGPNYPKSEERASRLRAALHDMYSRHHAVTLQHVAQLGKREARQYIESLEGVPAYVAARVSLLQLGVHAAPVDCRMTKILAVHGFIDPGTTADALAGILERRVRSGELVEAYLRLKAWTDGQSVEPPASAGSGPSARPAGKSGPVVAKPPKRRSTSEE